MLPLSATTWLPLKYIATTAIVGSSGNIRLRTKMPLTRNFDENWQKFRRKLTEISMKNRKFLALEAMQMMIFYMWLSRSKCASYFLWKCYRTFGGNLMILEKVISIWWYGSEFRIRRQVQFEKAWDILRLKAYRNFRVYSRYYGPIVRVTLQSFVFF